MKRIMDPMRRPLISIITPSRNVAGTIRETMESVVHQLDGDSEHLLIDACSDDGTLKIASQYPHLTVRSEPDRGIYDGMNKGASLASGDWLLFLQADDWLPAGALKAYRRAIATHPDVGMICGGAEAVRNSNGQWKAVWSVADDPRKKLSVKNIALDEPMINARLIRSESFRQLGGFSPSYSLASDRDFLIRAALQGVVQIEIPEMTYRYRWHEGSSTMTEGNALTERLSLENLSIARNHLRELEGPDGGIMRRWHGRLTVQAAMNGLEQLDWKRLLAASREGISENPAWPFSFALEFLRSLPGFLLRGGKTRSQLLQERKMS